MSCTILLPVDGSACSEHAAQHVAQIASIVPGMTVHIVNVQPLGDDWMVRRMIKAEELAKMEQAWGSEVIVPIRAIIQAAGVMCSDRVVQGEVAHTIARLADELGCDQIVMGLGGVLLGSVASKVLHLAKVPVTLVK